MTHGCLTFESEKDAGERHIPLVPAEAGTQLFGPKHWMPACAGMSGEIDAAARFYLHGVGFFSISDVILPVSVKSE
jgi:hypothetical protein